MQNELELELKRAQIFRGRQHKLAFLELKENSLLVSEIRNKINSKIKSKDDGKKLNIRETSRALRWLSEKGFAKCLNPSNEHGVKGIVYVLTEEDKKIRDLINELY
jgi:hypothetical protein